MQQPDVLSYYLFLPKTKLATISLFLSQSTSTSTQPIPTNYSQSPVLCLEICRRKRRARSDFATMTFRTQDGFTVAERSFHAIEITVLIKI
jgi:hypothetical protein